MKWLKHTSHKPRRMNPALSPSLATIQNGEMKPITLKRVAKTVRIIANKNESLQRLLILSHISGIVRAARDNVNYSSLCKQFQGKLLNIWHANS